MPLTGQRLWSRLSKMSSDELTTRLRQEVSKRLDVALYGWGLPLGSNGLKLSAKSPGNFFFSQDELPGRIQLLRQHLPQQEKLIVDRAETICQHRFSLLGYRDVSYGERIDWQLDAVHGKRSRLIPWFKINFLDFDTVGDHKVTWELNRHQHLVTLAKAWALTGEKRFADEVFSQWYSWQRANPYPLGANWASSLEVGFRSLSWIWVDHLLAGYAHSPAGFREDLIHGLALNGRHIEKYLSTYFSPNTHLLGEAVALFALGVLYPQIQSAERWKNHGWKIIQQEAQRQVRPDGVYFEQSLYYHVYALDFFLYARLLAQRNGITSSAEFDRVIRKMLSFVAAVSQDGPPDGFGDDDGGRLFDGTRNRAEHMQDPLAIGSALFPEETFHPELTEEAIWLLGSRAIPSSPQDRPQTIRSFSFPDGGVFIIASAELIPQQMIVDAGPQGTGHCGHGHADALSVKFSANGNPWLVDSGTYNYIGPGNERNIFRGTRAHNTLTVDGTDQAVPEGPFAWSAIPETRVDLSLRAATFSLFAASHNGYERLPNPVRHRRFIFHLHGHFWIIRDVAEGRGSHLLETSWHFGSGVEISPRKNGFVAWQKNGESTPGHMLFLPAENSPWTCQLSSDFISPAYGEKVAAPVLRCSAQVDIPAEHAVLLNSGIDSQRAEWEVGSFSRHVSESRAKSQSPAIYRYESNGNLHFVVFPQEHTTPWDFGPWSSDAGFFYFHVRDRRIDRVFLVNGRSLQFRGTSLFSLSAPLQWLEWSDGKGQVEIACSDGAFAVLPGSDVFSSEVIL